MGVIWYATREDVKSTLDMKETARSDAQVDREIAAASRMVEGLCHRRFYPEQATKYFNWPDQYAQPYRLWLDDSELLSVDTLTSGGITIPSNVVLLEPNRTGPPYNRIELRIDSTSAFSGGNTPQRDITITGLWGYTTAETPVATVVDAMTSSTTSLHVTDASGIGVGQLLRIGAERLTVTGRQMADTGQTLQAPLTERQNDQAVHVSNGAAYTVGEVLLLDAERMLIVDIAGNTLIVRRAWDGSTLAAHTAPTVYASRLLTVTRGVLGTTAAAVNPGAQIYRWDPPADVRELVVAEAVIALLQGASGYARITGVGSGAREVGGGTIAKTTYGAGIEDLRDRVYTHCGRKNRTRAV